MKNDAATAAAQSTTAAAPPAKGAGLRQIAASRADLFFVDEENCVLDPGFNVRQDFSHVPAMADAFRATNGETIPPLLGRFSGADQKMHVTSGESRLRAVRLIKERGGPNILLPFRMEPREDYAVNGLPGDKRTLEILTGNSGRPLNILEQGMAMQRLIADHQYDQGRIAKALGVSLTHVGNCLRLVNDAHESLRQAVRDGLLSPTLALDIMAAEPDTDRQAVLMEAARTNAGRGNRITARHIPVHVGKERQQQQREQTVETTTLPPAEMPAGTSVWKDAETKLQALMQSDAASTPPETVEPPPPTPAPPATVPPVPTPPAEQPPADEPPGAAAPAERRGFDSTPAIVHLDLPKSAKVTAVYSIGNKDGRFYCGFEIESDLQSHRRPSTSDQESFTTYEAARLAAIQSMLGFALKQKTAKGGANWLLVAGELRALIKQAEDKARAAQGTKAVGASPRPATSAAPVKPASVTTRSVEEFRGILNDIDPKDANPTRYNTAMGCLKYLEGGCTHSDLARYLLDVDRELGGGKLRR